MKREKRAGSTYGIGAPRGRREPGRHARKRAGPASADALAPTRRRADAPSDSTPGEPCAAARCHANGGAARGARRLSASANHRRARRGRSLNPHCATTRWHCIVFRVPLHGGGVCGSTVWTRRAGESRVLAGQRSTATKRPQTRMRPRPLQRCRARGAFSSRIRAGGLTEPVAAGQRRRRRRRHQPGTSGASLRSCWDGPPTGAVGNR